MTSQSKVKRQRAIPLKFSIHWFKSPWAILISVILGIYLGAFHKDIAVFLKPIGDLYLGLLKMCVLPILLAAITTSIGKLMRSSNAGQYVRRILMAFPLGLLITSGVTVLIALVVGPGRNLSEATLNSLGVLVNDSGIDLEMALTGPIPEEESLGLSTFLLNLVPENIFDALSTGQTLKVLVFSMIVGISLGLIRDRVTDPCFDILEAVYKTFNQLINWLTMILPFGLLSLLAYQLSQQGVDIILSMLNFILVGISIFVIIYILSTLIIWQQSKTSLPKVITAMREPTLLALATSSSLACLPSSITQLTESLNFERQAVNLVTPLSITICRFGSVIYFALGALFVAQLYNKPLGLTGICVVMIGAIFAGMATSGVTGVLTLTMLGLVLEPLKLPLEAVLVLFIAIDPIMDPFRTLGIVHTGIAATAVVADLEKQPVT
jgi:proton glutamate symport protein